MTCLLGLETHKYVESYMDFLINFLNVDCFAAKNVQRSFCTSIAQKRSKANTCFQKNTIIWHELRFS